MKKISFLVYIEEESTHKKHFCRNSHYVNLTKVIFIKWA